MPDDDLENLDEDVEEVQSSSSRPSSRLSAYSRSSAASDTEPDAPSAPKRKGKAERPQLKKDGSSGSNIFLTAAEQRALQQKDDKKSSEDPFSFLVDPKDKDGVRPGQPGYDPRTLYIPPKAWKEFTPFEKQVCTGRNFECTRVYAEHAGSFGRSNRTILILCCSFKRANSWSFTRRTL